jgi:hypothetical protein
MITAAMQQPYFCPYSGFFEKMALADVFVLLDAVQFPRGGTWLTRNRFKNDGGVFWLRVPVRRKGLFPQRIMDVAVAYDEDWAAKALQALRGAYGKAPYYPEHADFLAEAFSGRHRRLAELNGAIISYLAGALGIGARIVKLSELGISERGEALPGAICRAVGAHRYVSQTACEGRVDVRRLRAQGVAAEFFRPSRPVYPQLWGEFISNLSVWDMLLCCGPKARGLLGPGVAPV